MPVSFILYSPVNELTYKTSVAEAFDVEAEEYIERCYSNASPATIQAHAFTRRWNLILNQLRWERKQVLDLGSGPGVYMIPLVPSGCTVWHLDASWGMVQACARRIEEHASGQALAIRADAEHLPFRSDSFDGVICAGLVQYLMSEKVLLSEVRRVLKPGGEAIISIPNKLSPLLWLYRALLWPARMLYWAGTSMRIFSPPIGRRFTLRRSFVDRTISPPRFIHRCKELGLEPRKVVYFGYTSPLTGNVAPWLFTKLSDWCDRRLAATPLRYLARDCLITLVRSS